MNTHECESLMRYLDHLAQIAGKDLEDGRNTVIGVDLDDFRRTMIDASVTINSFLSEREDYLRKLDAIVTAFINGRS